MDKRTMRETESRGATVEAAVAAGLLKLSLSRDEVEIDVIDEGSRGLLGIGSREAVVRIRPIAADVDPAPSVAKVPEQVVVTREPEATAEEPAAATESTPAPMPRSRKSPSVVEGEAAGLSDEELTAERDTAVATLIDLLDKMHVDANIEAELSEPDDLTGQRVNVIDITGDDLSLLIGPRGETLDALQFLTRMMVAHKLQHRAYFVIDIEGYRQRRQQALTRLAERMAAKAVDRGQPVSLEPMSSYERRVIHMALRDSPDVYTESTGEGKYRKVRIYPKS